MKKVAIVGAGMAGCEVALQLAARGIPSTLFEMRPERRTEAHETGDLAELVCSNSFRSDDIGNAVGLIKEEMRRVGGVLMQVAHETRVPAGGALAVDRVEFARAVSRRVEESPLIELRREEVTSLPVPGFDFTVVATGPLTSGPLAAQIRELTGVDALYFYDAIAPIVDADSIDMNIAFSQSRYGKGDGDDYINCPMNREQYTAFIEAMNSAELVPLNSAEDTKFFEACLPVEEIASRGIDTLRYGPMKPLGSWTSGRASARGPWCSCAPRTWRAPPTTWWGSRAA